MSKVFTRNQKLLVVVVAIFALISPLAINGLLSESDTVESRIVSLDLASSKDLVFVGDEVDVDIFLNDVSDDLGAVEFVVSYPVDKLEYVLDSVNNSFSIVSKEIEAGIYKITVVNMLQEKSVTSTIHLATLSFRALSSGKSTVFLDPDKLRVTLSGSNQYATVSGDGNLQAGFEITQRSEELEVSANDLLDTVELSNVLPSSPDLQSWTVLASCMKGFLSCDEDAFRNSDINNDGSVDDKDATILQVALADQI